MKFTSVFVLCLTLFSLNVYTAPINSLCTGTGVKSIWAENLDHFESNDDYCLKDPAIVPAPIQRVIRQAAEMNEKTAAMFGLSLQQLFGPGLSIILNGNFMGAVG